MSISIFDERTPITHYAEILPASGTNAVTLLTAASPIERVDDVFLLNNDTIDHVVRFFLQVGAVTGSLPAINVPAGAGWGAVAPVRVFDTQMPTNQAGWVLPAGDIVQIAAIVAVQAGKYVSCQTFGGQL